MAMTKISLPGLPVSKTILSGVFVMLALSCATPAWAQYGSETMPTVKAVEVQDVERQVMELAATDTTKPDAETKTASPEPAFQGLIPTRSAEAPAPKTKDIVTYGLEKPTGDDTHPILKITPDKSELVRLDSDAASIIVGNPDHLGVLMDNRRLLILVPRQPGATYLTVLNAAGEIIMQRHVIIASPQTDYIRIRRSCAGQPSGCQETSVYYCPGMCHTVGTVATKTSGAPAPLGNPTMGGNNNANAANDNATPDQQTNESVDTTPPVIPVTTGQ